MKTKGRNIIVGALITAAAATGVISNVRDREPTEPVRRPFQYGPVVETEDTLDVVFRFNGMDSEVLPRPLLKATLLPHRSEGFRIKPKGRDFWSAPQALSEVVTRLEQKVGAAVLGQVWWVKAVGDGFLAPPLYKWDRNPTAFMDTPGTHSIDVIVGTVVQKFPQVGNLGIFVCKRISGSSTYSQHSWANGVDFGGWGGPWGSGPWVANLDAVNDYIYDLYSHDLLPVSQLGWRNWPNHYPGHIHVSGAPMFHGIPECA